MAEILPRHYIIAVLIFAFAIVGGVTILSLLNDAGGGFSADPRYSQFNDSFNVMNNVIVEVDSLENKITNASTDFGAFGVLNSLISTGWNTLKLLPASLSFMDSAYRGMSEVFGVPAWIPMLIAAIVTVIIIFAILSAIFQREI